MDNECVSRVSASDWENIIQTYGLDRDMFGPEGVDKYLIILQKAYYFRQNGDYLSAIIYATLAIWTYQIAVGGNANPSLVTAIQNLIKTSREKYKTEFAMSVQMGGDSDSTLFKTEKIDDIKAAGKSLDFNAVIGAEREKSEIRKKFVLPTLYPFLFSKPKNNILLYGPPGTGKTYIAKATAVEFNSNNKIKAFYITASANELRSKWEGGTEKNIAALFNSAKKLISEFNASKDPNEIKQAKVIIFLDEVEQLASDRTRFPENARAVTTFLQQLDGFGTSDDIMLMAATNLPWDLDGAFLRRFQSKLLMGLPDFSARCDLFHSNLLEKYSNPTHRCFMQRRLCNLKFIPEASESTLKQDIQRLTGEIFTEQQEIMGLKAELKDLNNKLRRTIDLSQKINIEDKLEDIDNDIKTKTSSVTNKLQDIQTKDKEYGIKHGYQDYLEKYKGKDFTIKAFLPQYFDMEITFPTMFNLMPAEKDASVEFDKILLERYITQTKSVLPSVIKQELSFIFNPREDVRGNPLISQAPEHLRAQYITSVSELLNQLSQASGPEIGDIKMGDLFNLYMEIYVRVKFRDVLEMADESQRESLIPNLIELAWYLHFLADVTGPSPIAKIYNLDSLGDYKTSMYARTYFGYSNSDLTNIVNNFFGNMAQSIISAGFVTEPNSCGELCQKCNINQAVVNNSPVVSGNQYCVGNEHKKLCVACYKKSSDGRAQSFDQIVEVRDAMFLGETNNDIYVTFKESQFNDAIASYASTTGEDPMMCNWWFYASNPSQIPTMDTACKNLINKYWKFSPYIRGKDFVTDFNSN